MSEQGPPDGVSAFSKAGPHPAKATAMSKNRIETFYQKSLLTATVHLADAAYALRAVGARLSGEQQTRARHAIGFQRVAGGVCAACALSERTGVAGRRAVAGDVATARSRDAGVADRVGEARGVAVAAVGGGGLRVGLAAVGGHSVTVGPRRVASGDYAHAVHAGGSAVRARAGDSAAVAVDEVVRRILAAGRAATDGCRLRTGT